MSRESADHHDAELALKVYDLRRETVMRESRSAINGQFWPKTLADVQAVATMNHPLNAAYRQTVTYWEMVYAMVRHGIVHPDFFLEVNGEGFFLFAKVQPFLDDIRRESSPTAFQNAEWVATNTEAGKRIFAGISARVRKALEARG